MENANRPEETDFHFNAEKIKEQLKKLEAENIETDEYKDVQYPIPISSEMKADSESAENEQELPSKDYIFDQSTHGTRLDIISKLNEMFAEVIQ